MLAPDQFDTDGDLPSFTIAVENLHICETDFGPVEIPTSYSIDWSPVFHLDNFVTSERLPSAQLSPSDFTASIRLIGSTEATKLRLSKLVLGAKINKPRLEAGLFRHPIAFGQSQSAAGFEAVVLSPPAFSGEILRLQKSESSWIELAPFKSKGANACILRACGNFSRNTLADDLGQLIDFLTFVKGSYAGIGNVKAYDEDGATAFNLLGFSRNDIFRFENPEKRETNWFDLEIQDQLPKIYTGFTEAISEDIAKQALRQTIAFYRASTVARASSIEMAIIAAHTALEAIVNYILEYRAGWSPTLLSERTAPFSDKACAAAAFCRFIGDTLAQSPELMKMSKARNNMDAHQLVSFMRNKLVHQDPKFTPTGVLLVETWTVAMWLVEVFVFYLIGYRGDMVDRRVYKGWRGTTCKVPLSVA